MPGREAARTLPQDVLERIDEAQEIDIETTGRRSGEPRRATVWVVVVDDAPCVRSEYAERGQWYQNALANPDVAIWVDGRRIPARATKVTDPEVLRRVSEAIRTKYSRHAAGVDEMVAPNVELATVSFTPA
jgi:deazaflavin-dependent oxidoreductase (nitroreductase family)